ncbi:hypothetical protein L1049_011075 [Liquidambar formosana]|uniref:Uncharacterized protein n=1 Tax=Liquidambar formosana TaxID=63359 RepID=A0AAP0RQJ3_LIQFO
MTHAISVLETLDDHLDHESVNTAKAKIAGIEGNLLKLLEEIMLSPRLADVYELASVAVEMDDGVEGEEVNEDVVEILQEASGTRLEKVDLSGQWLRFLPRVLVSILGLIVIPNSLVDDLEEKDITCIMRAVFLKGKWPTLHT